MRPRRFAAMPSPEPQPEPHDTPVRPKATLLQVMSAVFWSFFGVRKGSAMNRDAVTIRPWQVIVVGVFFAVLLVLSLIALVRLIVASAA
jgi:hypothetical protein